MGREGLDGPEVSGMVRAGEVILRDSEVAFDVPLGWSVVPDQEKSAYVVIPDSHHGTVAFKDLSRGLSRA